MRLWKWLSWILGVFGALLVLAASVPFEDLTQNLTSYIEPLGLDHLFAYLADEKTQSAVFRFGILLLSIVLGAQVGRFAFRAKRQEDSDPAEKSDHWAERQRLEISVLANVSAGREPTASPIDKDPENSRVRELNDAIDAGHLVAEINGERPNVMSTVTLNEFTLYVAATNKPYWVEVLHRWQLVQNPAPDSSNYELKEKRIPLLKFLEIARKHGWDVLQADGYEGYDLLHGINEAAGLGDLVVLGKIINQRMPGLTNTFTLQRIPAETWRTLEIDALSCFKLMSPGIVVGLADDNAKTQTKFITITAMGHQDYANLHLETKGLMDWLKNDAETYRGHTLKAYGE